MVMNNPYAKYQSSKVMTASKEELTLMLYEGALKFCNQAIIAIERKNIEEAHHLIIRVEDIIKEFRLTLNKNYDIALEMDNLYDYMLRKLIEANTTKNIETLEEVRDLIRDFRDTWKEAIVLARAQK